MKASKKVVWGGSKPFAGRVCFRKAKNQGAPRDSCSQVRGIKEAYTRGEESRRGLSPGLFPPDRVAIMNGFCLTL